MEENLPDKQIQKILGKKDLHVYRQQLYKLAEDMDVDVLDYAAALLFFLSEGESDDHHAPQSRNKQPHPVVSDTKMIRYRLEVGRKHQVTVDQIKKTLVEESGVERSRVGQIDLQKDYCIVSLPSGMPADIYMHLKKVSINHQELRISRVGGRNRNFRRRSKQRVGQKSLKKDNNSTGEKDRDTGKL